MAPNNNSKLGVVEFHKGFIRDLYSLNTLSTDGYGYHDDSETRQDLNSDNAQNLIFHISNCKKFNFTNVNSGSVSFEVLTINSSTIDVNSDAIFNSKFYINNKLSLAMDAYFSSVTNTTNSFDVIGTQTMQTFTIQNAITLANTDVSMKITDSSLKLTHSSGQTSEFYTNCMKCSNSVTCSNTLSVTKPVQVSDSLIGNSGCLLKLSGSKFDPSSAYFFGNFVVNKDCTTNNVYVTNCDLSVADVVTIGNDLKINQSNTDNVMIFNDSTSQAVLKGRNETKGNQDIVNNYLSGNSNFNKPTDNGYYTPTTECLRFNSGESIAFTDTNNLTHGGPWCVSMWVKNSDYESRGDGGGGDIIFHNDQLELRLRTQNGKYHDHGVGYREFRILISNSMGTYNYGHMEVNFLNSPDPLETNEWVHIVVNVKSMDEAVEFYVNGIKQTLPSGMLTAGPIKNWDIHTGVAGYDENGKANSWFHYAVTNSNIITSGDAYSYFNGWVDRIHVFDYAKSANDIYNLYTYQVASNEIVLNETWSRNILRSIDYRNIHNDCINDKTNYVLYKSSQETNSWYYLVNTGIRFQVMYAPNGFHYREEIRSSDYYTLDIDNESYNSDTLRNHLDVFDYSNKGPVLRDSSDSYFGIDMNLYNKTNRIFLIPLHNEKVFTNSHTNSTKSLNYVTHDGNLPILNNSSDLGVRKYHYYNWLDQFEYNCEGNSILINQLGPFGTHTAINLENSNDRLDLGIKAYDIGIRDSFTISLWIQFSQNPISNVVHFIGSDKLRLSF